MEKKDNTLSRREFLRTAGIAAAGITLAGTIPAAAQKMTAASAKNVKGANGKVNLACIGIGNRGNEVIKAMVETGMANIVALCDVDLQGPHTQEIQAMFPGVPKFKDYRQMFDKMANQIEAVLIAIPDFAHFYAVMLAMSLGKHVYVEKPLGRTFYECELMIEAARRHPKVVTQMGNQGHSEANYFQFKAWTEAGIIKNVTEITAHMNSPRRWHGWDTNIHKFPDGDAPLPAGMDWDVWLGGRPWHDYSKEFHNGQWRCWYEFGMGALGDWGAHILDTAHEFLELGLPYEVVPLRLDGHNDFFYPYSSTIQFRFPRRRGMPSCDVTWYDGLDNLPPLPEGFGTSTVDASVPSVAGGQLQTVKLNPGKILYSKDLVFKGRSHAATLSIIPSEKAAEMEGKLPEVPASPSNHFANFLKACRGEEKTRSPFEISGPLSQVFCLGVIAQRLGQPIKFDVHTKQITNNEFANAMLATVPPRKGWTDFYSL